MLANAPVVLAVVVALIGAVWDYRTGEIPNGLSYAAMALGPLVWLALGFTGAGWGVAVRLAGASLLGMLVCGLGPAIAFARGAMGKGDVKLLAGIGALLGPRQGMNAELTAFLVASLWALGILAWRGRLFAMILAAARSALNPFRKAPRAGDEFGELRFGPAIFVGTTVAALVATRGGA